MKKILICSLFAISLSLFAATAMAQRGGHIGGGGFHGGGGMGGFHGGGGGFHPQPSLPGGNFGGGSIVHHDAAPMHIPAANRANIPAVRPNADSGRQNLPNIRPGEGGAGTRNLPNVRPGEGGAGIRNLTPSGAQRDPARADHNRESLQKALADTHFDPAKIDKSKLNETVRNRLDKHPINIDNSKNINVHPENNVMKRDSINNVRQQFANNHPNWNHNTWNNDWYHDHPGAWQPPHPVMPPAWWGPPPSWDHAWGWFAAGVVTGAVTDALLNPFAYNYGSNVYYSGDTVYVNNSPYVSADEYYDQACDIADAGDPNASADTNADANAAQSTASTDSANAGQAGDQSDDDQWLPLGTYGVLKDPDDKDCKRVLQLAVSKDGKIAGNLVDVDTNQAVAVYGSVDPKTQRVAFHAPGHDEVAECGYWNLTQDSLTMLVHLSKDKTEERTLIRLTDSQSAPENPKN